MSVGSILAEIKKGITWDVYCPKLQDKYYKAFSSFKTDKYYKALSFIVQRTIAQFLKIVIFVQDLEN